MLKMDESEENYWITIRYERIPDFCFKCGRIFHVAKECTEAKDNMETNKERFEFGAWMKFQGFPILSKDPEISKSKEEEMDNKNSKEDKSERNDGRRNEGFGVDLNMGSSMAGSSEMTERRGKEIDIMQIMEE